MPVQMKKDRVPLKKIVEQAAGYLKDPDGLVFFFDEARFGLQPQIARQWALRGERISTSIKTGYSNFYLYAAVDPKGGECFILELPRADTEIVNIYLKELSETYPNKNILLIWDQAGYHKSKALRVPVNITIETLPPYSPELNPAERLWRWLRRHACRNRLFKSLDEQAEALGQTIRSLNTELIASMCSCGYLLHDN
jgi:putative transposase